MKEIKFRAWDNTNKKFIKDIMLDLDGKTYVNDRINIYSQWREVVNVELMQFTGLKDKNGKEIYEGDVVEFKYLGHHVSEIKKDIVGYYIENNVKKGRVEKLRFDFPFKDLEIIGNIYESPKLLKRKK